MPGEEERDGPDRKAQIINSALGLMSNHGVAGTTTARIAADVGVSEPALYRHFKNKREILLAALDEVSARLILYTTSAADPDSGDLERLRQMSAAFYDFVMSHPEETRTLFDAVSAVRDDEMRAEIRLKFAQLLEVVAAVLRRGVERGAFRGDLDVALAAWEVVSLGVGLYFASVLGFEELLTKDKALTAVERLFASFTSVDTERSVTG